MKNKIKIRFNREVVASDEIQKRQNFQDVLNKANAFTKPFYKQSWFKFLIVGTITVSALSTLINFNKDNQSNNHTTTQYKNAVFLTDSLEKEIIKVNTTKDQTITTQKGTILHFPKGSLVADKEIVTLEIQEAYDIKDIIKAGLITKADQNILSSGGMFRLEPVKGEKVTIQKNINIEIPTAEADTAMKLFSGEKSDNGIINWKNPKPILNKKNLTEGKHLYELHCEKCHTFGSHENAPDLAYIKERRPQNWLYDYIRKPNPDFEDENQGKISPFLYCYDVPMPQHNLNDNQIKNILSYITKISKSRKLKNPDIEYKKCSAKKEYYYKILGKLREKRDNLNNKLSKLINKNDFVKINNEFNNAIVNANLNIQNVVSKTGNSFELEKVTQINKKSEYYQIEINTFGWYNIDELIKYSPNSKLIVNLPNDSRLHNTFLIIPSIKVHISGGLIKNKTSSYGFYASNGDIYLPQNTEAYVYSLSETPKGILFDIQKFTTKNNNIIQLQPKLYTLIAFNKEMKKVFNQFESIKMEASINTNALKIAKVKKENEAVLSEIEKFDKLYSECDCRKECVKKEVVNLNVAKKEENKVKK